MSKPTTIHQEVVEKYGKKPKLPSERIQELVMSQKWEGRRQSDIWVNAIIAYLDEEHERAVKEFSNK